MKSVFSFIALSLISLNASAGPIDVAIYGKGGPNVCVTQNKSAFSKRFYIAREMARLDAKMESKNACLRKTSFASECGEPVCQDDTRNVEMILPKIEITPRDGRIDIVLSVLIPGSQCLAENKGAFSKKLYSAKAPTELEAKAIAMNACLSETSFASECAPKECEAIAAPVAPAPGRGGRIRLPRIPFPRVFNN